ncbi:hypothetical protein AAD001_15005 [Colwelliaceae bacterium 6471]
MSWKQFHFKCRYFLQKINEDSTLQQANQSFENSDLDTLYSDKKLTGIQKELFDKIFTLSSIKDIQRTLQIFSSIDLAANLSSSDVYKNIINKLTYLEAITVVFVVFITIYKLFVYPAFSDLITQYPSLSYPSFDLIPSMWVLGLTVSTLTLMFTFSYRKYVKSIDTLIVRLPSKVMKFLIPKKAVNEIIKLNKIITTPLEKNRVDDDFNKKITALVEMGLDESFELSSLFIHHSEKLEFIIWQHAKRMFTFMYTLVTLGIAFYIIQIYDPIFKLGAIVE